MLFSSMSFLVLFLPVTLAGYFLLPKALKNLWLLAVSMVFYAWGEPDFVVIMAASIAINYGFGLAADRFRDNKYGGRIVLILMTFCNLGILGYYKYMNFFVPAPPKICYRIRHIRVTEVLRKRKSQHPPQSNSHI